MKLGDIIKIHIFSMKLWLFLKKNEIQPLEVILFLEFSPDFPLCLAFTNASDDYFIHYG